MTYTPAKKAKQLAPNVNPQNSLIKNIERFKSQIQAGLPRGMSVERFQGIITASVIKNPDLATCDPRSFFAAVRECVQLGLEPDTSLQHAHLLPYHNSKKGAKEVQLQLGFRGIIDLVERSGDIKIEAHDVCENDYFDHCKGTNPYITHKLAFGKDVERGEVIGAYAIARFKEGEVKFDLLDKKELEKARAASKSGSKGFGPWKDYYGEMAKKTAIKRLAKQIAKHPEVARMMEMDTKSEIGDPQDLHLEPESVKLPEAQAEEVQITTTEKADKK